MADIPSLVRDLVVANRILASESVVDAYGHVSVRHPDNPHRFFMATSMAPELVEPEHIVELNLDCTPVRDDGRPLYHERFIHGGILEARPDVQAVVHAHSEDVLPFTIVPVPLRPVIHSGSFMGATVPVWDMADRFGTDTNLLVTNMEQARDLARCSRRQQRHLDARARLLRRGALAHRSGADGGLRAAQRPRPDERAAALERDQAAA